MRPGLFNDTREWLLKMCSYPCDVDSSYECLLVPEQYNFFTSSNSDHSSLMNNAFDKYYLADHN